MTDEIVMAKAKAAVEWCRHASDHAKTYGGKSWTYLLISNDAPSQLAPLLMRWFLSTAWTRCLLP